MSSEATNPTHDELISLRDDLNERIAMLRIDRELPGVSLVWFDAQINALQDVIEMIVRRLHE